MRGRVTCELGDRTSYVQTAFHKPLNGPDGAFETPCLDGDNAFGHAVSLPVELREALQAGELTVEYQPKRNLRDNTLAGVEALARWRHPVRGDVPPAVFVAVLSCATQRAD